LHNTIIKDSQLKKEYSFEIHNFPKIDVDCLTEISCHPHNQFQRYSDVEFTENQNIGADITETRKKHLGNKIKSVEEEAYDKGFNQGITEGVQYGKKEIEPLLNKFEDALTELENVRKRVYQMAEKEAVDLSLAIARKIVGNEISINKNVITNIVREALKKVEGHDSIKIKLNPSEIKIISDAGTEFESVVNCFNKIEFSTDDSISAGGCIIETDIGDIDARIEKQFKVVEDAFKMEIQQTLSENG